MTIENIDTAEEGQTEETLSNSEDTVELHEASIEDLDAYLENALKAEAQGKEEPFSQTEEQPSQDENPEDEGEKKEAEDKQLSEAELAEFYKAKYEEERERRDQQEKFIQRRNTELGNARKELLALKQEIAKQYQEKSLENPEEALALSKKYSQVEQKLEQVDEEARTLEHVRVSTEILQQHVKPEDWDVEAMSAALERDGLDPSYIGQFRQNPIVNAAPDTLVHLAKRAKAEKAVVAVARYARQLEQQIKDLKKTPSKVVQNIQNNLKKPPVLTNGATTKGEDINFDPDTLSSLSSEQLDELLKKMK